MRKILIMQMVHSLKIGGSEKLATTISSSLDKNCFSSAVCAMDLSGELTRELDDKNIPHHVLHRKGVEVGVLHRIYKLLKKHKVDIVHTHHFAQLFYTVLPALLSGVKIVHTEHEYNTYRDNSFSRKMIKPLSSLCHGFTTVSQNVADYFIHEIGIAPDRVVSIPNGIDIRKFDIRSDAVRKELDLQAGEIVFGIVGRLEEEKNHRCLLNSFSSLSEVYPGVKLLIVGEGSLIKALEEHVKTRGISDSVFFLGNRMDIPEVLSAIDVFVLSSVREGLPIALIEAMAARKPVVCTDVGSIKSMVLDGINGFLVPPNDQDAIFRAMANLIVNPDMRKEMGEKGHDIAGKSFDLESMIGKYEKIYRSLFRGEHVWN